MRPLARLELISTTCSKLTVLHVPPDISATAQDQQVRLPRQSAQLEVIVLKEPRQTKAYFAHLDTGSLKQGELLVLLVLQATTVIS